MWFPFLVLGLCIAPALVGCTHNARMIDEARLDYEPLVEKLPLTVGLYYSDDFANKVVRARAGFDADPQWAWDTYIFDVGETSVLLFDQVASSMFKNVEHLTTPPDSVTSDTPIDGVLVPKFVSLHVRIGDPGPAQSKAVSITYQIQLFTSSGIPVESWEISGRGVKAHGPTLSRGRHASEAARSAIRNAFAEFLALFYVNENTKKWLRESAALEVEPGG